MLAHPMTGKAHQTHKRGGLALEYIDEARAAADIDAPPLFIENTSSVSPQVSA
jgi:hypothetical protein